MESTKLPHNQINSFVYSKKRNKYKNFSSASEYRKDYYAKNPEKYWAILEKKRAKYLAKVGGKLKYNKSVKEHAESNLYKNWFRFFTSHNNLRFGYKKDGSDVRDPKYLEKNSWDSKGFLKVIKTWHLNRQDKRSWSKYVEFDQMGIALGIKSKYTEYRFGCIDIDKIPGYANLFRSRYVSNRIGSVHFYFLYKENDLGKQNLIIGERKDKNGKAKEPDLVIGDLTVDFKMCQYMMAPLSLHHTGNLYRIRGKGSFIIGKFEKASEVLTIFAEKAIQKQTKKWIKQGSLFGRKPLIKVYNKKLQHLFKNFECQVLYVGKK